jgi:hypothetical protein|tara:strand:+ start:264 stop:677 length:414 start_codon:yes stop_codon:yes gene_type:complete
MKITKSRLRQIIKEELENSMLDADPGGGLSASELRDIADDLDSNDAEVESSDAEIIEPYVMRNIRDTNKRAFENNTPEDVTAVAAAMPGSNMIDFMNPRKIQAASENNSSNDVLFLGVSPQHIYFKTMDDAYYRIPR